MINNIYTTDKVYNYRNGRAYPKLLTEKENYRMKRNTEKN